MLKFERSKYLDDLIPPAHAEPSVASFFRSAPVKGSVVNLFTRLVGQLIRGFQFVDDQFQALQTQVTEVVQSLHTRLQKLEAEVAQIHINMRNILHILMAEDQLDLT
jgi:hypothetical protein